MRQCPNENCGYFEERGSGGIECPHCGDAIMQDVDEPTFEHDCPRCTFLGHYDNHDLYHCTQGGKMPTAIGRFGHAGKDYVSGGRHIELPVLVEAWRRAKERGL